MDESRQPRITCYQRAWLRLIAEDRTISVRTVQLSGRHMRIVLSESLAPGAAVSVEPGDWLALGEVCFCSGEYSHYVADLQLEQMLVGLQDIRAWRKRWLNRATELPSFVVHVGKEPLP